MRLAFALTALGIALLLAAACSDGEDVVTQDIVTDIPWVDGERTEYAVFDDEGEDELGTGVYEATLQGDRYLLSLNYEGELSTDESEVVVDATTLKPLTLHREVHTDTTDQVLDGDYDAEEMVANITLKEDDNDEESTVRRLKEHYYDNESSVFLWRTIPFAEGYEASYHAAVLNLGRNAAVTLRVVDREEITVPAGTFDTWVVEIEAGGAKQKAWFSDSPEHWLVQYDNTLNVFRLKSTGDA
ncbi:MAG: DUF3108 domain-containing protein [Dehalococcoidia bacterium]